MQLSQISLAITRLGQVWTPAQLFSSGEVGIFLDPSDLTSMFQDSAGTTAAAIEQPVGLLLDKSKGLVLGAELVTNGDFSSATGWTVVGSTITAGVLRFSAAAANSYADRVATIPIVAGKLYLATYTVVSISSGSVRTQLGGKVGTSRTSAGTYTQLLVAISTGNPAIVAEAAGTTADIDNISVRELPGNHASQATAASRPTLSARKNWLLATTTLATQNVTTRAAEQVLSFYGTGTVTLSGTSTAGPLVGTGASDRVSLTFTPTAGTLTLTVSGSVTNAQLEDAT